MELSPRDPHSFRLASICCLLACVSGRILELQLAGHPHIARRGFASRRPFQYCKGARLQQGWRHRRECCAAVSSNRLQRQLRVLEAHICGLFLDHFHSSSWSQLRPIRLPSNVEWQKGVLSAQCMAAICVAQLLVVRSMRPEMWMPLVMPQLETILGRCLHF